MKKSIGIAICCLMLSLSVCGSAFADRVTLPKTGQTAVIATGDDGTYKKGMAWPSPRFTPATGRPRIKRGNTMRPTSS